MCCIQSTLAAALGVHRAFATRHPRTFHKVYPAKAGGSNHARRVTSIPAVDLAIVQVSLFVNKTCSRMKNEISNIRLCLHEFHYSFF